MDLTIANVREHFGLSPIAVNWYAMRPSCGCGRSVIGHSYSHLPNGVICHVCLYGVKRSNGTGESRVYKVRRNRRDGYERPKSHCPCCGKQISDKRSRHCGKCEATLIEKRKKDAVLRALSRKNRHKT